MRMRSYLKTVLFWLLVFCGMLMVSAHPVLADVFIFGSETNYSQVVLPNQSYVHQGENISQGNYYDLSGIYGFSGMLCWWANEDNVGMSYPDKIITLSGNPNDVYINPAVYPVGQYFQWDGGVSNSSGYSYSFGADNAYVFYVNPEQQPILQEKTVVHTSNITISQNGSLVEIPVTYTEVQTFYAPLPPEQTTNYSASGTIEIPAPEITSAPEPVNPDVQDQNGIPINGGVSGAAVVTAKGPVAVEVPVFAAIVALVVLRRKR
jgi:Domain of unknown function (DUF3821)